MSPDEEPQALLGSIEASLERLAARYGALVADLNQLAARIVERATDPDEPSDPPAQTNGRSGGLKGGKARAAKLSPEQRSEIARKAAQARWGGRTNRPARSA